MLTVLELECQHQGDQQRPRNSREGDVRGCEVTSRGLWTASHKNKVFQL